MAQTIMNNNKKKKIEPMSIKEFALYFCVLIGVFFSLSILLFLSVASSTKSYLLLLRLGFGFIFTGGQQQVSALYQGHN